MKKLILVLGLFIFGPASSWAADADFTVLAKSTKGIAVIRMSSEGAINPLHLVELSFRNKIQKDYGAEAIVSQPKIPERGIRRYKSFIPNSILVRKDGSILIGGKLIEEVITSITHTGRITIKKKSFDMTSIGILGLKADGKVDPSFSNGELALPTYPASLPSDETSDRVQYLTKLEATEDSKILVSGVVGERKVEVRLHSNGIQDSTYGIDGFVLVNPR